MARKYVDDEYNKIQIPESEIKSCYDKNKDTLDNLTIRDIVFYTADPQTDEPLSDDKVLEASKNALDMLNRIKAGEDMQTLALKYSEDTQVQQTKGEYTLNIQTSSRKLKLTIGQSGQNPEILV